MLPALRIQGPRLQKRRCLQTVDKEEDSERRFDGNLRRAKLTDAFSDDDDALLASFADVPPAHATDEIVRVLAYLLVRALVDHPTFCKEASCFIK